MVKLKLETCPCPCQSIEAGWLLKYFIYFIRTLYPYTKPVNIHLPYQEKRRAKRGFDVGARVKCPVDQLAATSMIFQQMNPS